MRAPASNADVCGKPSTTSERCATTRSRSHVYDLPTETLARLSDAHVGSTEPRELRVALAASVRALRDEGVTARVPNADVVAERLSELR
jgi:hypothetical protein